MSWRVCFARFLTNPLGGAVFGCVLASIADHSMQRWAPQCDRLTAIYFVAVIGSSVGGWWLGKLRASAELLDVIGKACRGAR